MPKSLSTFTGQDFYGVSESAIQGQMASEKLVNLTAEIEHFPDVDSPYSQVNFLDSDGVKWQIRPSFNPAKKQHRRRPDGLQLWHRNGMNDGFHDQRQGECATRSGLQSIIRYIKGHEDYEVDKPTIDMSEIEAAMGYSENKPD